MHDRDGLLFPPGDAAGLASILIDLAEPGRLAALAGRVTAPGTQADWARAVVQAWSSVLGAQP